METHKRSRDKNLKKESNEVLISHLKNIFYNVSSRQDQQIKEIVLLLSVRTLCIWKPDDRLKASNKISNKQKI